MSIEIIARTAARAIAFGRCCGDENELTLVISKYLCVFVDEHTRREAILTRQCNLLLDMVKEILVGCDADLNENPWRSKYCEAQIYLSEVDSMRELVAECERDRMRPTG